MFYLHELVTSRVRTVTIYNGVNIMESYDFKSEEFSGMRCWSMQIYFKDMEAARSNRSSSTDREEPECDSKVRDVEPVDDTSSEQDTGRGESSAYQAACPQEIPGKSEATGPVDNDMEMILRRKIYECGLGDMRVPETHMSGCSECEDTDSDEDDDLCSTSSDDSDDSYNPLASGVMPPVLPVCLSLN